MPNENEKRRSNRVSLALAIVVTGTDFSGQDFVEQATTISLTRDGGSILLSRGLGTEQTIYIRCQETKLEAEARVVGQIGLKDEMHIYGVELLNKAVELWGVQFPDVWEALTSEGRLCIQCVSCKLREVACLNEIDIEVFETNRNLWRYCSKCKEWTMWKEATGEVPETPPPSAVAPVARPPDPAATPSGPTCPPVNRRRYNRTKVHMTACIHQPSSTPDIVSVVDVSRGGICFKSKIGYEKGAWVEVAVPYSGTETADIFIRGRIVRVKQTDIPEQKEYGVEYMR